MLFYNTHHAVFYDPVTNLSFPSLFLYYYSRLVMLDNTIDHLFRRHELQYWGWSWYGGEEWAVEMLWRLREERVRAWTRYVAELEREREREALEVGGGRRAGRRAGEPEGVVQSGRGRWY